MIAQGNTAISDKLKVLEQDPVNRDALKRATEEVVDVIEGIPVNRDGRTVARACVGCERSFRPFFGPRSDLHTISKLFCLTCIKDGTADRLVAEAATERTDHERPSPRP